MKGHGRHSRHFWAHELRHWASSAKHQSRFYNTSFCQAVIVTTNQANQTLTAAGYRLLNATPLDAGGLSLTATHGDTTHTTDTARMTLGDIGQWLFRAETTSANARTLVSSNMARAILLGVGYVQNKS